MEYTWDTLGTIAGCSAAVLLITQYVKDFLPRRLPTRAFVLALSCLLLALSRLFCGKPIVYSDIPLVVVNSFTVALTAMGAYETAVKKAEA